VYIKSVAGDTQGIACFLSIDAGSYFNRRTDVLGDRVSTAIEN
jgi:hypothetical protein